MVDYKRIIEAIDKFTTDELIKSMINSVNDNQVDSKTWMVDKLKPHLEMIENPSICVAAGWFGLSAHLLSKYTDKKVVSFDMDPFCEPIGRKMFSGVKFETADMRDYDISKFDIIVCTSCEHVSDEVLNDFLKRKKTASLVVLQSNNYYNIKGHVNCKKSIGEFIDSININVIEKHEKPFETFSRYMVIGA